MNFVILARPRTGSTMLTNYLNKQPEIACESEIFHHKCVTFPPIKHFTSWVKDWVSLHGNQKAAIKQKFKTPKKFFNFLAKKTDKKITGYKVLLYQLQFFTQNFEFLSSPKYTKEEELKLYKTKFNIFTSLKNNNGKVIFLKRRNEFLRCLSAQKAWRTNYPIILKDQNLLYNNEEKSIVFNIKFYQSTLQELEKTDVEIESFLKKEEIPYFVVYYEDLIGQASTSYYQQVANFLGQTPSSFLPIKNTELDIKKQNIFTLKEQIKNFRRVSDILKDDVHFQEALKQEENKK